MQRISVFGLGYVGCVSAACLASAGYDVIGVELNEEKVNMINEGRSPIIEPGLEDLLSKVVGEGKLRATTSCEEAVQNSDVAFICVGTPGDEHGKLQLGALERVSQEIGSALHGSQRPFTVVVRSTVLPGTTKNTVLPALLESAGKDYEQYLGLAMNPEFIREGSALKDFAQPPLTLVGCEDSKVAAQLEDIYSCVEGPFVTTELATAESVKYVCNAYHALKVCFANEMADACTAFGADAQEVMRIFRMDTKLNISEAYLKPGFAFGGSCLPKDLKALLYAAHHEDVSLPLMDSVLPSNEGQIRQAVDAVLHTGKKRIGVVGLSFKADTDDLRESPLVTLVEALIGKGCDMCILDRNVSVARLTGANRRYIEEEIPHISTLMCEDANTLVEHAEVLVIGGNTPEAKEVLERASANQVIVDLTRGTIQYSLAKSKAA